MPRKLRIIFCTTAGSKVAAYVSRPHATLSFHSTVIMNVRIRVCRHTSKSSLFFRPPEVTTYAWSTVFIVVFVVCFRFVIMSSQIDDAGQYLWRDVPIERTDTLLNVANDLSSKNILAIKFLLSEHVSAADRETHTAAIDFLNCLFEKHDLKAMLPEVLLIIQRIDILKVRLGLGRFEVENRLRQSSHPYVSEYR